MKVLNNNSKKIPSEISDIKDDTRKVKFVKPMNFLPTKPPPLLSDHMYELLRERILGGAYKPGQRLDVGAIAQQLGVSQTPLKEALAALAREGLVEIKARSGTYVAQLATRDMIEVFDIRISLELLAAETLLAHVTASDLQWLSDQVQVIQATQTLDEHYRENAKFHQRLVLLSDNRKLAELYDQLHAHVHIALVHLVAPGWWHDSPIEAQEHTAIVATIRANNGDELRAAMQAHLRRSRATLARQLG